MICFLLTATAISLPLILVIGGISTTGVDWRGFSALFYAALIGTLFGVIAFNTCVHRFGATTAAMTQYVVPVVAGLGGILLLGEHVTAAMLIGVALVIGGITIDSVKGKHARGSNRPTEAADGDVCRVSGLHGNRRLEGHADGVEIAGISA